ncbi:MAG: hypothetical protein FWD69_12825 [Polyangiaceae bacterium]|nr:hypothetical protein [Polyangiaceae bacterium]
MKRLLALLTVSLLAITACEKKSTPESDASSAAAAAVDAAAPTTAPADTAAAAVDAAAPTTAAADTAAAVDAAAPAATAPTVAPAIADTDIATPADFEEKAETSISKTTYKSSLSSIEAELAKE